MDLLSSRKQLIISVLSLLATTLLVYFFYYLKLTGSLYFTLLWVSVVAILLSIGNTLIAIFFDWKLPWLKFGTIRFVFHLLIGIVYSLLIGNLAYFLFKYLFTAEPPVTDQIIVTNVYGVVIFIPLFSIYFSLYFLKRWRKSLIATEKSKKEKIRAELISLKDHLDPHFLFNNLNILSSLIEIDTERSQQFLSKFAEVYRAILKSKQEDLVTLKEELEFIESYIFLIKTRFQDDIQFNLDIDEKFHHFLLPPLSIQMLVENAVKHNAISLENPLEIIIFSAGNETLTVKNSTNIQTDLWSNYQSGIGLKNLKGRYSPFTNREIEIRPLEGYFEVKLPLLDTIE